MAAPQARASRGEAQNSAITISSLTGTPAAHSTPYTAAHRAAGIRKDTSSKTRARSAPNPYTSRMATLPMAKATAQLTRARAASSAKA